MTRMPGWWEAKREASRRRKASRKVEWVAHSREPQELGPVKPYDPHPNPTSWYQFCTDRKYAYESRGEPVAAMIYWLLRSFELADIDPCTEEGWAELCAYWGYKSEWLECQVP